jgi:hypothetical protein
MEQILEGILTMDFWLGFVGAIVATAFLAQPVITALDGKVKCLPRRLLGVIIAVLIGTLIAWLWAQVDGGLKLRNLLRDGIVNGAASSLAYENIVKPWLARRKQAAV